MTIICCLISFLLGAGLMFLCRGSGRAELEQKIIMLQEEVKMYEIGEG